MTLEKLISVILCFLGSFLNPLVLNPSSIPASRQTKEMPLVISAEEARAAVIFLVEKENRIDLKMGLDSLKKASIENLGNNKVKIGKWNFNLKEKTFSVSIETDEIFAEYSGSFKKVNDQWLAKIERELRN